MAPRRKCAVCGSKTWHKEPTSGIITCSEGHVLLNYRNETHEVTELGAHAVRKRTLKSGRKKKERQSKADPKLYHGERARFHYFQCLQVIFRMQVAALTRLWDLPPEFEMVCRDVWALSLALLPNPPVPEPLLHAQDELADESPSQSGSAVKPSAEAEISGENVNEHDGDESAHLSDSSSSSSDSESESEDSELEELMRENSETPSDEEDEPGNTPKMKIPRRTARKRRTFGRYDTPASTVSCLVLACWTLRLPVMYRDFTSLIESYDLPYLDPLRLLPESLTHHLRKHTVQALSPHHAPSSLHLHRLTSRLARLLYSTYDIYTPEMNAAPILWKSVRALQGTPTLYVLTKSLARLVSIPLTLHRYLAPALVRTKKRDPTFHKQDNAIPEVALVSAAIVVMKMVYGLDGSPRCPQDANDPACALPALANLIDTIRHAGEGPMKNTFTSTAHQRSALDMDDHMIDAYLEFCEKALLPREDRLPARNITTDYFPLADTAAPSLTDDEAVHPGHSNEPAMNSPSIDWTPDALRPGQDYHIYNTQDILGTVPEHLELVVSRAAQWAGVDDDYVLGVVERFERRVVSWMERVKRKERNARASASE